MYTTKHKLFNPTKFYYPKMQSSKAKFKRPQKITERSIVIFYRQLSTLMRSGIPIIQCCQILSHCQNNEAFNKIICAIKIDLETGKNLTQAMVQHKNIFDPLTCEFIHLGEQTGNLELVLTTVAEHKEKDRRLKKNIIQALLYPMIIFTVSIIVFFIMLLFVVPHFSELFKEFPNQLPTITLIIFSCSSFVTNYIWTIPLVLISISLCLYYFHKRGQLTHLGRIFLNTLPIITTVRKKILLAQFALHMTIVLRSGMTLAQGLNIIINSIEPSLKPIVAYVQHQITHGEQLYKSLQSSSFFPPLMTQLIRIGEESGNLELMLEKISEFYRDEVDVFFQSLSQVLEPLIMIVLGVLISGLMIALYLPIFKLGMTI